MMPGAAGAPHLAHGAPMPGMAAAQVPPGYLAPGTPIFIIVNGPQEGQRVALKHGFTLGKAPGSDVDLSHDGFASTNHAIVTFDGQAWTLVDRGSTNGTFVNGNRVQQVRLDPGTTVRLGSTEVRFWTA
jgi:pSer/pThr/pTyr-binding forkhead associated (FHA) protein